MPKTPFAFSAFIGTLCLICTALWLFFPYSPISLHAISEIIPDRAVIDDNGSTKLEGVIYFVRQSYMTAAAEQRIWPIYLYMGISFIALALCLFGLKKWAQIPRNYFFGGFIVWAGLIFWTNTHRSLAEISWVFIDQLNSLGIISLITIGVLLSAAIPRLLFQVGDSSEFKQSSRNWIIFFGFSLVNLLLTYGKEFLSWDIKYAIPGFLFGQIAWLAYSFQAGQLNALLRWGINLFGLSTILYFFISGNDPGISAFVHWTLICQ
ncbi:MAG: hypothetical protein KA514_09770, partial [Cytophagaceae bacterium]|nr:hypothetical protein [Cytophagaceae bacterium]